jgi:precorrin-4/cobalt-precorrin-4 C11-methyltransferase
MTVHFVGAGPGAADLITLRGRDLIAKSPVCLYAGSLVPAALLAHCPPGARIINTAPMALDAIIEECRLAHEAGQDVARLHSGDLSVWSAMGEQIRRLKALGIPFDVTPGVPAFAAAAATLEAELTLPGLVQSVVLTRTSGRASAMPETETLEAFAATRATLAIHLSIHVLERIRLELLPHYGENCPVALVFRASWPDQRILRTTLGALDPAIGEGERTALVLVGHALGAEDFVESRLYAADYDRRFRPARAITDEAEPVTRTGHE